MKNLLILLYLLVSFWVQAQDNKNDIILLKDNITNFEKSGNTKSEEYISSLNKLFKLYYDSGKYDEAEFILLNILEIRKEILGEKHPDYLTTLNNLAVIYYYQEKYLEAEISYLELIDKRKNILGGDPSDYISSLNNLAELYRLQKKYTKAKKYYEEAYKISRSKLKEDDKVYISVTNNLALLHVNMKEYDLAGELLIETLELIKKNFGRENLMYASTLGNMASLYAYMEEDTDVIIPLLVSALQIRKEVVGLKHHLYVESLINLAKAHERSGANSKAEPLLLKALEISKEIYGVNHQQYIERLIELSILYRKLDLNNKASHYFQSYVILNKERLKKVSSTFIVQEIINYVELNKLSFEQILSFINDYPIQYPTININYLDNELLLKNLSLRNQELIKKSIQKSTSTSLQDNYRQFVYQKKALQKLQELPLSERPIYVESLTMETAQLEKELINESTSFAFFKKNISINLNDVKDKLKKDEVVIDLVSFNYYKSKETDSIIYAAFVLGKDLKAPKFIALFEEKQLKHLLSRTKNQPDSTQINKHYTDKAISDLFFKPLENELTGIKTIYLSPSGLGHQIDFSALPISENQTFGQKYNIHILGSPAELVNYKVTILDNKSDLELLLYGGINYNKSNANVETTKKEIVAIKNETVDAAARIGISSFNYLPGTNKEVEQIKMKGTQNGFSNTILTGSEATKESIKQLDGRTVPFVLHLATHGFFFPDPIKEIQNDIFFEQGKSQIYKASDDPMLRSGLLFAGANNYWGKSTENSTTDDGILTAAEISNLDLSACQLVVLSACETGLGEINGSEGVFGLQRAFKMAGVKNIIMSLWKVPDAHTAELFDIFYSECFAGKTIHEAFQSAQSNMKSKYSPYYWAGFVLLE